MKIIVKKFDNIMINESFLNEGFEGENLVTGEDVARLLGQDALDTYLKGKQEIEMDNQMKEDVQKKFTNFMSRLNEVDKKNKKRFN